jgi:hypothetical protein
MVRRLPLVLCCVVWLVWPEQTELFRELVNVRYKKAQEKSMPLFRTIQWTWFVLAMVYICEWLLLLLLMMMMLM